MLDRTIPFKNIIMRCDSFKDKTKGYSKEYFIQLYEDGNEDDWAKLEYEIEDFPTIEEAKKYFIDHYCLNLEELKKRCLFAFSADGQIIGSCIAWRDLQNNNEVASLHWLIVSKAFQNKGIGKALLYETMKLFYNYKEYPVYLHTQPWSYKAIELYSSYGFRLMKKESFSNYKNEFDKAIPILQKYIPNSLYKKLLLEAK